MNRKSSHSVARSHSNSHSNSLSRILSRASLIAVALITVLFVTACKKTDTLTFAPEKIEKIGVQIDKPTTWTGKLQYDEKYVDYIINIPQTSRANGIDGRIAVNLVRAITPDEKLTVNEELSGLKKYIGVQGSDLKTLDEKDVTFLGMPAKRSTVQLRNHEDKTIMEKIAIILTVKDNQVYSMIFDEDAQDFDVYLPTFDQMTASAKFASAS